MTKSQGSSGWVAKLHALAILLLLLHGCSQEPPRLELVPPEASGLEFSNNLRESDSLSILDYLYFYNGGGLAIGDIDNDGLDDIFITSNREDNRLYLNKGDLRFEDGTQKAGVSGGSSWNTGAVMADVNGDGWLDIYVLAVVGINGFTGHNELYINNGDGTFSERAGDYNLDLQAYGTTASFFDYDLDGDLDVYILNHAVHTEGSFGRAQLRNQKDPRTGDRLFRNDGSAFTDVTDQAGIYSGSNGYGLGLAVADFNNDGFPDIYVGNDFHEDDYFYLNQGDGTFGERLREFFGHTSRFSMGNDAADINQDGFVDLISLDMLPYEERVVKSSEGDDTHQTLKMRTQQYGYHYQFSRNMLYLNRQGAPFEERALLSGVAATDWSWSALFEDLDQDGQLDLFISNGIPRRPNDLDYIRYASSREIQKNLENNRLLDQQALERMPPGIVPNFVFKGKGDSGFEDYSDRWLEKRPSVSGATAIADLDNDGDLEIVTNNIDQPLGLYRNHTDGEANFIKLKFQLPGKNPFGVGTRVTVYSQGRERSRQLFPSRGWQASGPPVLHLGLGEATEIDSVQVFWPDRRMESFKGLPVNKTHVLSPGQPRPFEPRQAAPLLFEAVPDKLGLDYIHKEDNQTDFDFQKLAPYDTSDRGPAMAVGDLDMDGRKDIFVGGARNQPPVVYLQEGEGFSRSDLAPIQKDSLAENNTALIADIDNDGANDLIVGNGGNLLVPSIQLNADVLYRSGNGFEPEPIQEVYQNSSVVAASDFDRDGDLDLFVGGHTQIHQTGKIPRSLLLENTAGGFEPLQKELFDSIGMITDAVWDDFDGDGITDLITVSEWGPVQFFSWDGTSFSEVFPTRGAIKGLWQTILPFDIDGDGDRDYLLGNWGLNSKFEASPKAPMRMYYDDFDNNEMSETIVATAREGTYYPLMNLDLLASQMPVLRKRFPNFASFAGKPLEAVFEPAKLQAARLFEVDNLASGFLRNNGGTFTFVPFPELLQTAPIRAFARYDVDGDGRQEALAGGNYFGLIPFHGRLDSFPGALIEDDGTYVRGDQLGLRLALHAVKHMEVVELNGQPYLVISTNNDAIQVYKINQ